MFLFGMFVFPPANKDKEKEVVSAFDVLISWS